MAKEYIANKELLRSIWQKIIIEMIGDKWESQEYSLGYKPKTEVIYDVGFNYFVGKMVGKRAQKFGKASGVVGKRYKDYMAGSDVCMIMNGLQFKSSCFKR